MVEKEIKNKIRDAKDKKYNLLYVLILFFFRFSSNIFNSFDKINMYNQVILTQHIDPGEQKVKYNRG
jgi:hypothetical protein